MMRAKMSLSGLIALCLLIMLFFVCCGDGSNEEVADGDSEFSQESDGGFTGFREASGRWKLVDTNAVDWLKANGYTPGESSYYIFLQPDGSYVHWITAPNSVTCYTQPMTFLEDENRFAPKEDAENCWFEFGIDLDGKLIVTTRSAMDASTEGYFFQFESVELIPSFDEKECTPVTNCFSFDAR